jgi:hydroxyacylglutathione hydrolase
MSELGIVMQHQDEPEVVVIDVRYGSMKNFVYLVIDPQTRDAVIVDPAWQIDKIERALHDSGANLRGVLVTHAHADHLHLANPLAKKYGCPMFMSKNEVEAYRYHAPSLTPAEAMPESLGELQVQAIATPGHTPGSTCYRVGDHLFTGDVLFAEGCGMCPDVEAAYAMYDSLQRLKALPPHTRVYPGHSYGKPPGQTLRELRRDNIYLNFKDRESFATFRLRGGQDMGKLLNFR